MKPCSTRLQKLSRKRCKTQPRAKINIPREKFNIYDRARALWIEFH
jgi:hypothetical protein